MTLNQAIPAAERPILFSGPMVKAILDGRKTITRRVVKFPLVDRHYMGNEVAGCEINSMLRQGHHELCPFGVDGDLLWVRETWRTQELEDGTDGIRFAADNGFAVIENYQEACDRWVVAHDNGRHVDKWRPSIFMPRWASRITLQIESVRVERLQDISEEDAVAEGLEPFRGGVMELKAKYRFEDLWDSINAKRDGGKFAWEKNPWVWVIQFKRV